MVREWLQPNHYLIGLDLKDQFLSVGMNKKFRKFLRFQWQGKLYEWSSLPFGLKCSPRVVTKLLKPVVAMLRSQFSIKISIYMDDIILQGRSAEEVSLHAQITILVLLSLGWECNWEKSKLVPSKKLTHLGFDICTETMTATLPEAKIDRLQTFAKDTLNDKFVTVHNLEKLIGLMESVRPVTINSALNYRGLQKQLLKAKRFKRVPQQILTLSQRSVMNLTWWASPTGFRANCTAPLKDPTPTLHLWTDASMTAAGGHSSAGGFLQRDWTPQELEEEPSINLLELRAAKEAACHLTEDHDVLRLHMDSKVAAAYIRRQGGTRSDALSREACHFWELMGERGVTILTPHWISSTDNLKADFLSRHKMTVWEICLDQRIFTQIISHYKVTPTLDAFATRENAKLERYMSWHNDPLAVGRDALMHPWDEMTYLFPPLPLIPKVVNKVREERIMAILVVPYWPSSLWWQNVQDLLLLPPLPLPPYKVCTKMVEGGPPLVHLDPLQALLISGKA